MIGVSRWYLFTGRLVLDVECLTFVLAVDHDDSNIANVGVSRAGMNQAAGGIKEMVGVVSLQVRDEVQLGGFRSFGDTAVDDRAGGVGWAVFSVGPAAQDANAAHIIAQFL